MVIHDCSRLVLGPSLIGRLWPIQTSIIALAESETHILRRRYRCYGIFGINLYICDYKCVESGQLWDGVEMQLKEGEEEERSQRQTNTPAFEPRNHLCVYFAIVCKHVEIVRWSYQ